MAAAVVEVVLGVMGKPVVELLVGLGQLWAALLVGVLVGWLWKPTWAATRLRQSAAAAAAAEDLAPSAPSASPSPGTASSETAVLGAAEKSSLESGRFSLVEDEKLLVTSEDLEYLSELVEVKDGGSPWIPVMDRSTPMMTYQAWRRDTETGPPQYRSRTVFEDAMPELVRDFFWDDEFRSKWDDMLIHASTLEECPTTGTMIVQWVRKFPFFCSDREYIIGRRIWEAGRSYYCVTKGVPYDSLPRRNKPRRVDLYYSSWCIRAVESNRGDGQMTACEVLLFHYEDMGIPWEIAKLGVRQGMWGAVKKIEPGLRAYQMARRAGNPPSRCASMAQINSKIDPDFLLTKETASGDDLSEEGSEKSQEKQWSKNIPKLLVVGGAVALAFSLDHGLLTKAVIFGVARRFGMLGKKL